MMVLRKEINSPWVPQLNGPCDTSAFPNYPDDDAFFTPASATVNELFNDF